MPRKPVPAEDPDQTPDAAPASGPRSPRPSARPAASARAASAAAAPVPAASIAPDPVPVPADTVPVPAAADAVPVPAASGSTPPPSAAPTVPLVAPVAASSAAAQPGAPLPAGAGPAAPAQTSRRRSMPFLVGAAAAIGVILLAGSTSWVVADAVVAAHPQAAASASAAPQRDDATARGARAAGAVSRVQGTVRSIDGDAWTIASAKRGTVDVTVTADTRYIADGSPASTSAFHVGDAVVVAGTRSDGELTAKRIVLRPSGTGS